jgi:DNA polymerase III subunit gamma/tau
MASQSLYRKWRSQTFADLVGQDAVIRTLKNALSSGNLAHAYLFTGPRGTGKTSMARLLAKTINCLQPQNGEPCNECAQCREITAGSSFNVLEIDAASNRGIDSIRDLREKVMMPPTVGRYKVYILDEAHMLTTEAFNALLKTLEEPPPHAVFVLATTDVHKMLPTVLSRCQRFDFKRFTLRQLVDRLQFVAQQEQVELQPGSAELIARAASGGMRDALSLLDQAIAYSGNVISLAQVQAMLGVADPRAIQKFIMHIAELDSPAGLHLIHDLSEAGADLRQINTQVAEYWRAMMLARAGANIGDILDNTEDEIREIIQTSKLFALDELTDCARVFAQNDLLQKSQGTPQLGLELALLACVDIHRRAQENAGQSGSSSIQAPVQRPSVPAPVQTQARPRSQEAPVNGQLPSAASAEFRIATPPEVRTQPVNTPEISDGVAPLVPAATTILPQPSLATPEPVVVPSSVSAQRSPLSDVPATTEIVPVVFEDGAENVPTLTVADGAENVPTLTVADVKEKWELVLRRVKSKKDGAKISALLLGYTIVGIDGTRELPVVVCKAKMDFHYKTLHSNETYYETIRWALAVVLDLKCDIRLLAPNTNYTPPAGSRLIKGDSASQIVPATPRVSASIAPPIQLDPLPPVQQLTKPVVVPPSTPTIQPVQQPAKSMVVPPSTPPAIQPEPQLIQEPEWLQDEFSAASIPVSESFVDQVSSSPTLARNAVVRENTTETPIVSETRLEMIKKHATSNPVVSEVMRIFKAEINDIQPK